MRDARYRIRPAGAGAVADLTAGERHQDRGRGTGRALMSASGQWATGRGCAGRARDPAGGALLPRAGISAVRHLPPQGTERPSHGIARYAA